MMFRNVGALAAAIGASMVLACAGAAMKNEQLQRNAEMNASIHRQVSIGLLQAASSVRGVDVPRNIRDARRGTEFWHVTESMLANVTLPSGKEISLRVKMATIIAQVDTRTHDAVVVGVDLLPMPKSVLFREAKAEALHLLRELAIEPDEQMRRHLAKWPNEGGALPHRATSKAKDNYSVSVTLRPAPDDDKWFVVITFSASSDAVRALWDPTFRAASEPTANADKMEEHDCGLAAGTLTRDDVRD